MFQCSLPQEGAHTNASFVNKALKHSDRAHPNVVDELELCVDGFGIRELDFFDSSFTIRKQRVIEICNEIKRRKLDIVWAARTRVDCISDDVLKAMRSAGCTRIYYGIEGLETGKYFTP